jgi:hypothetical protein
MNNNNNDNDDDEISASITNVEILDLLALLEHLSDKGRIVEGVVNIPKDRLPIPNEPQSLVISFDEFRKNGKIKRSK